MSYIGKIPTAAPLTSSDVADGIITNAKLAQDIISADTALGAEPADTDEFLVSDAGTLKRMDYSYIKGGGKLLQVVQTVKTDTFTAGSTGSWIDITGLTVDITPASSSNKVLVSFHIGAHSQTDANTHGIRILRDSTTIGVGATASARISAAVWIYPGSGANSSVPSSSEYLDSPSSTSALTYKLQMYANTTAYINQMSTDSDNTVYGRTASSITVKEISG